MRAWLLLLLVGCGPTAAVIGDVEDSTTDTGPTSDDTDPDTDTDTDPDTDTDTDTAAPDPLVWEGVRLFSFGSYCEDEVEETGVEVTADADHAQAVATCATCDHVFYVQVSPREICDGWVDIDTETWRGVEWTDHGATIYRIEDDDNRWTRETLAEATVTGDTLDYVYMVESWGSEYPVTGSATLR